jgi:hypothetical protein
VDNRDGGTVDFSTVRAVTTSATFGVDPAELLDAAGAARNIHAQLVMVREALLVLQAAGPHRWAPDMKLAAVAKRALAALLAAAEVAASRCAALEDGLTASAGAYARSDQQWVR